MEIIILTNTNLSQAQKIGKENELDYIEKIKGGYLLATDKMFFDCLLSTIKENKLIK